MTTASPCHRGTIDGNNILREAHGLKGSALAVGAPGWLACARRSSTMRRAGLLDRVLAHSPRSRHRNSMRRACALGWRCTGDREADCCAVRHMVGDRRRRSAAECGSTRKHRAPRRTRVHSLAGNEPPPARDKPPDAGGVRAPTVCCSRASIGELALLMAHVQGASAKGAVLPPVRRRRPWEHTDLWGSAAAIPGVARDERRERRRGRGFRRGRIRPDTAVRRRRAV